MPCLAVHRPPPEAATPDEGDFNLGERTFDISWSECFAVWATMFIAQPTARRTYDGPSSSRALPSSVLHATPVPPAPISTSNNMREGSSTIFVVLV